MSGQNQDQDQGMTISGGGYDSRSSVVFAVTVAMITCSTVFVFSRLLSRAGIVKKVLVDDYFILVAWVSPSLFAYHDPSSPADLTLKMLAFGLSFSICYGTFVGLGRHESDVLSSWQSALRKSQYAFSVLYVCRHGLL